MAHLLHPADTTKSVVILILAMLPIVVFAIVYRLIF